MTSLLHNVSFWFQAEHGTEESKKEVENEMPRRVKKRRQIKTADGASRILTFFSLELISVEIRLLVKQQHVL
jgi:hypothetical protein